MTTAWDREPSARELGLRGGGNPAPGQLTVTQRRHDGAEVARAEAPACTATLPDPKGSGLRMRCDRAAAHAENPDQPAEGPTHQGRTSLGGDWRWHDDAEGAHPHQPAPQQARPEALEHTLPDPEVTNARTHEHRTFRLQRAADPTGVSGTGVVAEGVQFSDGRVALRWVAARGKPSTACWDSLADMLGVHGHDGATTVEWT